MTDEQAEVEKKQKNDKSSRSSRRSSQASGGTSVYVMAEDAVEKLKILDYEEGLLRAKSMQPILKNYFADQAVNASSQWSDFVTVVSWLMEQAGHDFTVDKWDDPTTSANKMMLSLKQAGFELDFPVSKLKQAYGEAVCSVLNFLADKSLKKRGFSWQLPEYPEGDAYEEAEVDEEADLGLDDIEEDIEEEEDEVLYSEHTRGAPAYQDESKQAVMQNSLDPEFQAAWKTELERVGPRLKRKLPVAGNEWRTHLEQTSKHERNISKELPNCSKQLLQIGENLAACLERISTKERFLGNQFEHISQQYREIKKSIEGIDERHKDASEVVEKLSNELAEVTEALEELKGNMDTRGNSMTDTTPLQKMRKAVSDLKGEIKQMELQIGVVSQTLLQAKLKNIEDLDPHEHDMEAHWETKF